ncbi:MAG: hypothetical protein ACM3KR_00600 [Deltaproteobacteria bacterium]
MIKSYVWTKKAEERAKELGLEERKEGESAICGSRGMIDGGTAIAWLELGYIREAE